MSLHLNSIHLFKLQIFLVKTLACAFLCVLFRKIHLTILNKYYVLTLESYAYLNYNLFSNNGNFSQMKSLFTNKLLMTAPLGSSE